MRSCLFLPRPFIRHLASLAFSLCFHCGLPHPIYATSLSLLCGLLYAITLSLGFLCGLALSLCFFPENFIASHLLSIGFLCCVLVSSQTLFLGPSATTLSLNGLPQSLRVNLAEFSPLLLRCRFSSACRCFLCQISGL
jgi:hypothetical protein